MRILQLALAAISLSQAGAAISKAADNGYRRMLQRRCTSPPCEQDVVGPAINQDVGRWQDFEKGLSQESKGSKSRFARHSAGHGSTTATFLVSTSYQMTDFCDRCRQPRPSPVADEE